MKFALENNSFASVANEYDESLTSEQGDPPHSPETDDYNEIQLARSDQEQHGRVQRQRLNEGSRSPNFAGARNLANRVRQFLSSQTP